MPQIAIGGFPQQGHGGLRAPRLPPPGMLPGENLERKGGSCADTELICGCVR